MEFLEKDLEQIIWESDNYLLREKGLEIEGKKLRQLRIGNYGIADIVTVKKKYLYNQFPYLEITVFELKKEKVGISAFLQAIRYCKGIKSYFNKKHPDIYFHLKIVLESKQVDTDGSFIFLTDLIFNDSESGFISSLDLYSFKYDINGIVFKNEKEYNLVEKGF